MSGRAGSAWYRSKVACVKRRSARWTRAAWTAGAALTSLGSSQCGLFVEWSQFASADGGSAIPDGTTSDRVGGPNDVQSDAQDGGNDGPTDGLLDGPSDAQNGGPLTLVSFTVTPSPDAGSVAVGTTIAASAVYRNDSGGSVQTGKIVVACRFRNDAHVNPQPMDICDFQQNWPPSTMFAPGTELQFSTTRLVQASDWAGDWDLYPTYQYPMSSSTDFYHDGPDVYLNVQ
jgi:hypothetical protein